MSPRPAWLLFLALDSRLAYFRGVVHVCFRAVEGSIRSFNNLIEKLHHSTYLYLLSNAQVCLSAASFLTNLFAFAFLARLGIALAKDGVLCG